MLNTFLMYSSKFKFCCRGSVKKGTCWLQLKSNALGFKSFYILSETGYSTSKHLINKTKLIYIRSTAALDAQININEVIFTVEIASKSMII